jgi:hypothetical protein
LVYGVIFSWFFYLGGENKRERWTYFLLFLFTLFAVSYSKARGALLALFVILLYLIPHHPQKLKSIVKYSFFGGIVVIVLLVYFRDTELVIELTSIFSEQEQIAKGTGTGASRLFLWKMAYLIFIDHNWFFGVGPHNFGVWLPSYASIYWDQQVGLAYYGQVAHNDYITAIVELGIFGFLVYTILIFYFLRLNKLTRNKIDHMSSYLMNSLHHPDRIYFSAFKLTKLKYIAFALKAALIATLINHFFYALLYYQSFFWLIFTLNLLLYFVVLDLNPEQVIEDE